MKKPISYEWVFDHVGQLPEYAGRVRTVEPLCPPKAVADDTEKLLLRDTYGLPVAVVRRSSAVSPQSIAREMTLAREAKAALGPHLGVVVLDPLGVGTADGRFFCTMPYCNPLSASRIGWFVQRWCLKPRLLSWLLNATRRTRCAAPPSSVAADFLVPLRYLEGEDGLSSGVRKQAAFAAAGLERGRWQPLYVLAHNDLWKDNILLWARAGHLGFVLIDWGAARCQGGAFYDLLRLAASLRLSRGALQREVRRHRAVLELGAFGSLAHLLVSLGRIGLSREHFPLERYLELVETCCRMMPID